MITDKKTYKNYCLSDKLANSELKNISLYEKITEVIFPNPTMRFLSLLRKLEYLKNCNKSILGKFFYFYYMVKFKKLSRKLGFTIPLNVFGPGLSIPHYGTIVVNSNVRVGKNCRLHTCVNIGSSGGSTDSPQIGDNVYIGPGVIMFGNIVIADNITIAANATVNKSIEIPNVTIGGTPAKILIENSTVWWVKNRLNLENELY